jgi:DUF1680 family protein
LYVNLFVGSEAEFELAGGSLRLTQQTDYPWDGTVLLTVEPDQDADAGVDLEMRIRIPGWARNEPVPSDLYTFADASYASPSLTLNGETIALGMDGGFAVVDRTWSPGDALELTLPMPVRRVAGHPRVENNAGRLAIQRGPLVYAVEAIDNGGEALDVALPADALLTTEHRREMLGGVTVVRGQGSRDGEPLEVLAVPYFAWANRGPGEMAVWLPTERSGSRRE